MAGSGITRPVVVSTWLSASTRGRLPAATAASMAALNASTISSADSGRPARGMLT